MTSFAKVLENRIAERAKLNLRRELKLARGIDFTSNDYLGFSRDLVLRARFDTEEKKLPLSGSGSRLLGGELEIYGEVEKTCAEFSKQESALLFPSGYQANVGLFSALLTEADHVFSDELNHASIIDGIRLGRAQKFVYPHRDLNALQLLLQNSPKPNGMRVIVTESIFSMDGSFAPLAAFAELAEKYDAALVVDEAHATGIFRSGLIETNQLSSRVLATIHTGGKALGASGAWVAGSAKLRDYLIQYSRAFIFSTAPSPQQALLLKLSIEHWKQVGHTRSEQLLGKVRLFKKLVASLKHARLLSMNDSPIVSIVIGDARETLQVAEKLQAFGFDVRAVRPPTVPEGTSRLRIILHHDQSDDQISSLANSILSVLDREENR